MCCKTLCNRVVSEHRPAAERLVHGLDVRRKCVSDIAPKYAGLTVEYVVPTHGVCVLKVIVKHELSFIIDAERGIKVYRSYVGNYFTSLEMSGATFSAMKLDDELKPLLDMPVETMGLKQF